MKTGPHTVKHSGQTWTAYGSHQGMPVWPLEEFFARVSTTARQRELLRSIYPNGKPEGELDPRFHVLDGPSGRVLVDE